MSPQSFFCEEAIIKYLDKLFLEVKYIFTLFRNVANDFLPHEDLLNKLNTLERNLLNQLMNCGTDLNKIKKVYQMLISNMSKEFISSVKEECVGYTLGNVSKSIASASTINELLHFFHSYIINNEGILRNMPVLNNKKNMYDYPIVSRGIQSNLLSLIYDNFVLELDCGYTDIIGINDDHVIMMIRDFAHALTMEITTNEQNIVRIEYFIPKICNAEKVNQLLGVHKVSLDSSPRMATNGVLEVSIDKLIALNDFISKVPTDIIFDRN